MPGNAWRCAIYFAGYRAGAVLDGVQPGLASRLVRWRESKAVPGKHRNRSLPLAGETAADAIQ